MKTRTKMMLMKQGDNRYRQNPQNNYPSMGYRYMENDDEFEPEMAMNRRGRDSRGRYTRMGGPRTEYNSEGGFRSYGESRYIDHLPPPIYHDMDYERPQQIGFAMPYDESMHYGAEDSPGKHIYMGHAKSTEHSKGLSKEKAHEWVRNMENSDGSTGPHWSMEQTKATQDRLGIKLSPVEFFAAMNMMYSDYCKVARKFNADNPDFYAHMACAFLEDEDAAPHKLSNYYECIVEH